jgi:hypothetical protein
MFTNYSKALQPSARIKIILFAASVDKINRYILAGPGVVIYFHHSFSNNTWNGQVKG